MKESVASLRRILGRIIAEEGALTFDRYAETVLYHPDWGYYADLSRVGREGDFLTSVSVGRCFGHLLAAQVEQAWQFLGCPEDFSLIEQGANRGHLLRDLLGALEPPLADIIQPRILEPFHAHQEVQEAEIGRPVVFHSGPNELAEASIKGVVVCNELVDAFPFHRVRFDGSCWEECRVGLGPDGEFRWEGHAIDEPVLAAEVSAIGTGFPAGYTTEVRPGARDWINEIGGMLDQGIVLIVDYGFSREDYFHPDRLDGTLRCFAKHQASEDPFTAPGDTDITAHVEFTSLAEQAVEAGFEVMGFDDQGRVLTALARSHLLSLEDTGQAVTPENAAWIRQFKTLTLPGGMGSSFKVLALGKGIDAELEAFSVRGRTKGVAELGIRTAES